MRKGRLRRALRISNTSRTSAPGAEQARIVFTPNRMKEWVIATGLYVKEALTRMISNMRPTPMCVCEDAVDVAIAAADLVVSDQFSDQN